MPRKTFVAGEILTAADVNTNLMDQAVMVFADSAARGSAIPSPSEGMVTYLSDTNLVEAYTGAAFVPVNTGFTAQTTITATNASFSVPSLAFPIVKVTVIGGGGGGGASRINDGANGGSTTFDAGGAGSVSAAGGVGGFGGNKNTTGSTGTAGFASANFGGGGIDSGDRTGGEGCGGAITVAYLNLTGISTVNVTIGAGGAGGAAGTLPGGPGGRGEVIVEYVAA
jgi:hypothetical protein